MIRIDNLVNKFIKKLAVYNMSYDEALNILGLSRGASEEEAKAAFKKKVFEFHPDRNPDRDTTEEMKKVNRAYEVFRKGPSAGRSGWGSWSPWGREPHWSDPDQDDHPWSDIEDEGRRTGPKDELDKFLDDIPKRPFYGNEYRREHVQIGDFYLSIQAGEGLYSTPRRSGLDLSEYSALEVAIFDKNREFVSLYKENPDEDADEWTLRNEEEWPDLMDMPGIENWKHEKEVGPYIPIETVKEIIRYFQNKSGTTGADSSSEVDDILDSLRRVPSYMGTRTFPLTIGDVKLSIQASSAHYSEPREDLEKLSEYESFEVAILKSGDLVAAYEDDEYKDMPGVEKWSTERTVGPYIPKALLGEIIKYFQNKNIKIKKGDIVEVTLSSGRKMGLGRVADVYKDEQMGESYMMYVVHLIDDEGNPTGHRGTYFEKEVRLVRSKPGGLAKT